jgi:hypothetical protein
MICVFSRSARFVPTASRKPCFLLGDNRHRTCVEICGRVVRADAWGLPAMSTPTLNSRRSPPLADSSVCRARRTMSGTVCVVIKKGAPMSVSRDGRQSLLFADAAQRSLVRFDELGGRSPGLFHVSGLPPRQRHRSLFRATAP